MNRRGAVVISTGVAVVFVTAVLVLPVLAVSQTTRSSRTPLTIASMTGQDLFHFYCASCHGADGKGDGPVGQALKTPPPDLTAIAQRNGGTFSAARVAAIIEGTDQGPRPAHGSATMPVWGPIFRALDSNDTANRLRVTNLVQYLQSIQHVD